MTPSKELILAPGVATSRAGVPPFVACLNRLSVDHASISRRRTGAAGWGGRLMVVTVGGAGGVLGVVGRGGSEG